ncbi:hypothetical protein CS063_09655 [Sporanaerobium hydrogeniformans]|uniref:Uncharacterized protein n=1 Tax=Sporanaerobium hydrogeniformans TaxID=3072179 RepID=A0AC61DBA5_9FIRM|nr:EAL domain-containing protein [Sporanaerobium hydrogeniformans]PHV70559.1 hypothetical protein CS063_09655 [Sporanaerobium hydrogeniformans]
MKRKKKEKLKLLDDQVVSMDLRNAIQKGQFKLYYQPKIDSSSRQLVGAEALIRWEHPVEGLILPGKFIPLAEETGFITEIGKWVLQEACQQIKDWQNKYHQAIHLSINLSAIEFYQSNIVDIIKDTIQKIGIEAHLLQIELTESMVLIDIEQVIVKMQALQKLGIKIGLDDFGTGYSSLSHLQALPINVLKLDRSFITNIEKEEITRNIVQTIITLAKLLNLEVIAEGVEKIEQVERLQKMGCTLIQGYYYGEPLSKIDFERVYLDR